MELNKKNMENNEINLGSYIVPEETKNGVCIDIGCNLGDFTNEYKNYFKKIVYFEPQKILFDKLQKRFENDNGISGYNLAVWSESNIELELVSHKNNDHGSVAIKSDNINSDWTDNIINKVKTISLEDILILVNAEKIDYLKIDCETSEYPLLLNKDISIVKYIGVELHSQMGIDKFNELLNWINKTHELIDGDITYTSNKNNEVLFKLK